MSREFVALALLRCDLPTARNSYPMIDHRILLPASTFSARYCPHPRNPEPKAPISAGNDTHDPDAYCPSMSDSHLLPPKQTTGLRRV
ncbi:MAG TPA: hypothetical protein DCR20_13135, partial [Planctomycetaceae bacterium]|nr:hypothetical protein [Planctomycetaceae bacterium]